MSDEEIIFLFMKPYWKDIRSYAYPYTPPTAPFLGLEHLHEVESKLTEEQKNDYESLFIPLYTEYQTETAIEKRIISSCLYATAEQKKKALAQVLRPLIEKQC